VLVEAARRLKQERAVRVALVGGNDRGNPANISEATLRAWVEEGAVEWWGFRGDMPEVYRQAHIVTLPSLGEGLPTVLLEAAASGRPIVTTDVPGCRPTTRWPWRLPSKSCWTTPPCAAKWARTAASG